MECFCGGGYSEHKKGSIYDDDDLEVNIKRGQLLGRTRPKKTQIGGTVTRIAVASRASLLNYHAHRYIFIQIQKQQHRTYYYYYTTNIKEREKTPHQSEDDLGYLYRNLLPTLFVCGMASIARDRRKRQRIIRIRTQLVFVRR